MDENGNVEKLIFKIESPWGLERAKALAQGRTTKLFTNPPPLFRAQRGNGKATKTNQNGRGTDCAISAAKQTFFFS
jgi:hypothetical protein